MFQKTDWKLVKTPIAVVTMLSLFSLAPATSGLAHNQIVVVPLGGDAQPLANVITVAKKHGDFTDPVAAINSIPASGADSPSASNQYLILIAPGEYAIAERLLMREWVSIVGSGMKTTTLTGSVSTDSANISSLVVGANNASLSDMTITNTGDGNTYSQGIYSFLTEGFSMENLVVNVSGSSRSKGIDIDNSSPSMNNLKVTASGVVSSYGIFLNFSQPTMNNVVATSLDAANNFGIYLSAADPIINSFSATASSGTHNHAIYNGYSSSPTMNNITATATGGSHNYAIYNFNVSTPKMSNVIATASGSFYNYGIYNEGTLANMNNVTATAASAIFGSYGMYNTNFSLGVIRNSLLQGDTADVGIGSSDVRIINTQLKNGSINDDQTGTQCRGVYDDDLADVSC